MGTLRGKGNFDGARTFAFAARAGGFGFVGVFEGIGLTGTLLANASLLGLVSSSSDSLCSRFGGVSMSSASTSMISASSCGRRSLGRTDGASSRPRPPSEGVSGSLSSL